LVVGKANKAIYIYDLQHPTGKMGLKEPPVLGISENFKGPRTRFHARIRAVCSVDGTFSTTIESHCYIE
jgi:hypothetical protein